MEFLLQPSTGRSEVELSYRAHILEDGWMLANTQVKEHEVHCKLVVVLLHVFGIS